MMYKRILALMVLLCSSTLMAASEVRDPYKFFFNETFGNFAEEAQDARKEGKQAILIFFEMDECPFCHYMKGNILNRPDVQAYYREHFYNFVVDIEGSVEMSNFRGQVMTQKEFAFKENRVRATPVIAFYDLQGKELFRHTGRTSSADEFMLMGRYVAEGVYRQMPFTRYKREQRK